MLTDIFNEKATGRPEKINEMADLTEEITGGEDAQFKLQNGVNKIVNTILSDHARVDEWQQLLGSDVSVPSPYIPIVKTKDKLILSLIYTAGKAKKTSDAWQTSAEMLEDEGEKIKWAEKVLEDFRRAAERATAESNVKPQKVNQVKDKDTDNNDEQKALKLSEETEKLRVEREKFETMFNSAKTMLEQGAKSGFTGVQQGSSKSTTGSSKKQLSWLCKLVTLFVACTLIEYLIGLSRYERKKTDWLEKNAGKKLTDSVYFRLYAEADVEYSTIHLAAEPRRRRAASAKCILGKQQ